MAEWGNTRRLPAKSDERWGDTRNVTRRVRADFDDYGTASIAFDVLESDRGPVDTGLLDANGIKIFRNPERHVVGFNLSGVK